MSEPQRHTCASCGEDVLRVEVSDLELDVEVRECVPSYPCPQCGTKRRLRANCSVCKGTGACGEGLPAEGIAIKEDGRARLAQNNRRPGVERKRGEAIHRLHRCSADSVLAA